MRKFKQTPGPSSQFFLGNLMEFKRNPLRCMIAWQRNYGDLVHFKLGSRDFYLISHPDLAEQALVQQQDAFVKLYDASQPKGLALILGQGLITSTGNLWSKQRRLIQPVFHRSNVQTMLPAMTEACQQMLTRWNELSNPATVNISDEMMRLTIEVITQTMFGTSILNQIDQIAPALETSLRFAVNTIIYPLWLPLIIPTPANLAFKKARQLLDEFIYSIIAQRRAYPSNQNDLLQMLLDAEDPQTGEKMPDRQIRDEVLTIFSAGHETTANLLTWTLALLANNPLARARVKEELHTVLGNRTPDANSLSQLSYTRAILDESLRMRPPAGAMMRKLSRDTQLQDYALKAGGIVIFSIYNMHHHSDFWEQPELFNPERFLGDDKRNKAFMPFGIGHRYCAGNHFALTEGLLLLTMLLQNYDFQLPDGQIPEMEMMVTIKPKGGMPMKIYRTNNKPSIL
jgi:cytochrome P450